MKKKDIFQIVRCYFDRLLPEKQEHMARHWLVADGQKQEKDEALRQVWNTLSADADDSTREALRRVRKQAAKPSRQHKSLMARLLKYAAVAIIAIAAGAGGWIMMSRSQQAEGEMAVCHVPNGKNIHLILYDGTAVTLNAGSELRYPRHRIGHTRIVYLQGEAVFQVRHNAAEPFVVQAGSVCVEDVGTCFNVKTLSHGKVITTVTEGLVRVHAPQQARPVSLKAGQQAVCSDHTSHVSVNKVQASQATAWTKGSLVFNQSRLEDIIPDLEHKFDVSIVADPRLSMDNTYTMQFNDNETLEEVLNLLAAMGDMSYRVKGHTVWLAPE